MWCCKVDHSDLESIIGTMNKDAEQTLQLSEEMKETAEQSSEIQKLIEIINDTTPDYEPFLYSGT